MEESPAAEGSAGQPPGWWRRLIRPAGRLLAVLLVAAAVAGAAGRPPVQEIEGRLELQEHLVYELAGLEAGRMLYISVEGTADTLDPFAAILKPGVDLGTLRRDYIPELEKNRVLFQNRPEALAALNDRFFLAWNDRSGKGQTARIAFEIPAAGDYRLLVMSTPWRPTFGDFDLLLGIDAPDVLTGAATPTGELLANHTKAVWEAAQRVDGVSGDLGPERPFWFVELNRVYAGETLYVFLEATSGNLPGVVLQDYSGLPLASGQPGPDGKTLTLTYNFLEKDNNPRLRLFLTPGGDRAPAGTYRLLVGLNTPAVLTGKAAEEGRAIIQRPIPVQIGLRMDQITNVDQKNEKFGVAASLKMIWRDPALGFNPEECQCRVKTFSGDAFQRFVAEKGVRWPEFAVFNQQGNRWFQNRLVMVWPDGWTIYFERFSTDLQAPDFDFRKFPFDRQDFYIRVDSLRPEWLFTFEDLPGFSEVGKQLGEEEWVVTGFDTKISTETQTTDLASSRFSFHFQAHRHLTYYLFRIFLPLLIILTVSWFTFFLRDYSKRVDVAGGNLLLFIAFNFAIAGDLPRLGYLTFLDLILIITFVVTGLMLLLAVVLKRLEMDGRGALVAKVDGYVISFYPLAYILAAIVAITLTW